MTRLLASVLSLCLFAEACRADSASFDWNGAWQWHSVEGATKSHGGLTLSNANKDSKTIGVTGSFLGYGESFEKIDQTDARTRASLWEIEGMTSFIASAPHVFVGREEKTFSCNTRYIFLLAGHIVPIDRSNSNTYYDSVYLGINDDGEMQMLEIDRTHNSRCGIEEKTAVYQFTSSKKLEMIATQARMERAISEARVIGQYRGRAAAGSPKAVSAATAHGKIEGVESGERAGKDVGAKLRSRRDFVLGYQKGRTNPSLNPSAYSEGIKTGETTAQQQAHQSAFSRGYNAEKAVVLLGAPTNSNTQDFESAELSNAAINDLVSASLRETTLTAPAPAAQDLPRLDPPTSGPVEFVLVPAVALSGDSPLICRGLKKEEEKACLQAFQQAYQESFNPEYETNYEAAFKKSFAETAKPVFEAEIAQTDADAMAKGLAQGASDQGLLDGYAKRIPVELTVEEKLGRAEFRSQLQKSSLLVPKSLVLSDSNGDGVFHIGESVSLDLLIDNFGGQASAPGAYQLDFSSVRGLKTNSSTHQPLILPAVPADTRLTLKGFLRATIDSEFAGKSIGIGASLSTKMEGVKPLEIDLNETIHFPIEVTNIQSPKDAAQDGSQTAITLTVKNTTATPLPADSKIEIGFAGVGLGTIVPAGSESAGSEIAELAPGQEKELNYKIDTGLWRRISSTIPSHFASLASWTNGAEPVKTRQVIEHRLKVARPVELQFFTALKKGSGVNFPMRATPGAILDLYVGTANLDTAPNQGSYQLEVHVPSKETNLTAYGRDGWSMWRDGTVTGTVSSSFSGLPPKKVTHLMPIRIAVPKKIPCGRTEFFTLRLNEMSEYGQSLVHQPFLPVRVLCP